MIDFVTNFAQAAALGDSDFIKTITALVFWVGGYVAAPLIFMATLGVFKNIAGMGSGRLKGLRSKVTDKASGRFKTDKGIRQQFSEQKRNAAAQRSKYNWRNRRAINDPASSDERAQRPGREEWRNAQNQSLKAGVIGSQPSLLGAKAEESAKKEAMAAAHYKLSQETVNAGMSRSDTLNHLENRALNSDSDFERQAAVAQLTQQQAVEHIGRVKSTARQRAINGDHTARNSFNQALPEAYSALKTISPDLALEIGDQTFVDDDGNRITDTQDIERRSEEITRTQARSSFANVSTDHHSSMKPAGWQRWMDQGIEGQREATAAYEKVMNDPQAKTKLANEVHGLFGRDQDGNLLPL